MQQPEGLNSLLGFKEWMNRKTLMECDDLTKRVMHITRQERLNKLKTAAQLAIDRFLEDEETRLRRLEKEMEDALHNYAEELHNPDELHEVNTASEGEGCSQVNEQGRAREVKGCSRCSIRKSIKEHFFGDNK